ncbi:MAG: type II secretion system F family protein, partial [Candidatus Riflebacteria bacterium]|nr:type II secretion system F family protein [Candidatus Riflebacteria bacterium]
MPSENQKQVDEVQQDGPGPENRSILSYLNPFYGSVRTTELLLFTKYFASLSRAGIAVLRSLSTLSRQMNTYRLRKIIWDSKNEVEGGSPLYLCFRKYDDVFGMLYCNLIRVGEESGRLVLVLDRLSALLERRIQVKRKVIGAMTYPAIITLVATLVVIFLLTFVIPQFSRLFEQFNQQLPWLTQKVIDVSNFLTNNFISIFAAVLAIILIVYQINQTKVGRRFFDGIKLKVPVFGGLIQKYVIALYARNLATLFESGINIVSAMNISNEAVENVVIQKSLEDVVHEVEGGIPIAKALSKAKIMPELSVQMIEVGEESGNLDEMLTRVAEFYEDEINFLIDQITAMVEPAFIVVIGAITGVIVLAMYLPI